MTMSVTQQQRMTLPAIERQVAQLEEQRASTVADHAQALRRAEGETMVAARRRLEELTRRRAFLLAPCIHARLAVALGERDAAAAHLEDVQQSTQASQQDVLDQRSRLAGLNSLDSSGRREVAQRLVGYEATASGAEEQVTAARRRCAAAHAWTHDLSDQARRLDLAAESAMTGGAIAARAAVVDRDERRAASALSSAAVLVQSAAAHQDACVEGLRLSERETAATRDRLTTARRLIAGGNVLDPVRHQREAELPALERAIREAEEQEGIAQRRYAAASRQLRDAKADQAALVERHAQRLPLFVRALDDLLDAGMGIERALTMADEAVR